MEVWNSYLFHSLASPGFTAVFSALFVHQTAVPYLTVLWRHLAAISWTTQHSFNFCLVSLGRIQPCAYKGNGFIPFTTFLFPFHTGNVGWEVCPELLRELCGSRTHDPWLDKAQESDALTTVLCAPAFNSLQMHECSAKSHQAKYKYFWLSPTVTCVRCS